ncbi:MAG: hypothetical protein H6577_25950 [Lewinellaceae bacterium]|nr:hypothetical protein [Saprospiraceae bacterium]MCB9341582.1 hypothetical protein [Lewinellaceae bacterium]
MEKKILFGTLGGFVAGNVIAAAIFMGLMGGMLEKWMADNAACVHEMSMTGGLLGSLVLSLFIAILLHKFGVSTIKSGAIAGAWITFLMVLWYGIWNATTFTAYTWSWLPYDLIGNTVTGAIAGGVIGWIYGKVK